MDGDLAGRRDDPPDLAGGVAHASHADDERRSLLFPSLTLAAAFGFAVAGAAIFRSGVLGSGRQDIAGENGNWLLSASVIAAVAATWLAGVICLIRLMMPRSGAGSRRAPTGWTKTLAAFAFGPALAALFFVVVSLTRYPAHRIVAYPVLTAALLVLVFARSPLRLLAERLLLSFFLWLAILAAPAFWRDEVSRQMSESTFGLLGWVGLFK